MELKYKTQGPPPDTIHNNLYHKYPERCWLPFGNAVLHKWVLVDSNLYSDINTSNADSMYFAFMYYYGSYWGVVSEHYGPL